MTQRRYERPVREIQGGRQDMLPEQDGDAEPEPQVGRKVQFDVGRPQQDDRRARLRLRPRTEGRLDGIGSHTTFAAAVQHVSVITYNLTVRFYTNEFLVLLYTHQFCRASVC